MSHASKSVIRQIWSFYYDGFKNMTIGKTLWTIILIKLFIMFFVLKLFFFKRVEPRFSFETPTEQTNTSSIINQSFE